MRSASCEGPSDRPGPTSCAVQKGLFPASDPEGKLASRPPTDENTCLTRATAKPSRALARDLEGWVVRRASLPSRSRSEEHTSELQSPCNLVCRLLLEKKKT